MIFTNCTTDNSRVRLYYRTAFQKEVFEELLPSEQQRLVQFTSKLFCPDIKIEFSDSLAEDVIGLMDEREVLVINKKKMLMHEEDYPLELYLFILETLAKRYAAYRKNSFSSCKRLLIASRIRKKVEQYVDRDIDIIILHLVIDELLAMRKVFQNVRLNSMYLDARIEELNEELAQKQDREERIEEKPSVALPQESIEYKRGR